jgi:glycosyltransferase involved in cell wall biosynthesis
MEASDPNLTHPIKLSVVIPCYNHGEFILQAIASVESCPAKVYEILIINDGSTDPLTQQVLQALTDRGYQVIHQENQGLAIARNHGISLAKGRYILPLDSDNKIRPNYITKAIKILDRQPEVGVVYGNFEFFGGVTGIKEVPEFDINLIVRGNYIDACAVFRKTVWEDAGGYDDKIPEQLGYEDWDFWLSVAEKGWHFYHIDEVLFDYRLRSNSMVSRCNIPEKRWELFRYISTKHIGLYQTNFAHIFANLEYDHLVERDKREALEAKLEKIQLELDLERSQFEANRVQLTETQNSLTYCESELQETKNKLASTQEKLQQLENDYKILVIEKEEIALKQKQTEANLQGEIARSQTELSQQIQAAQAQWQIQIAAVEEIKNQQQNQLAQTENNLAQSQAEIQRLTLELHQAQEMIQAMQTSKFWQLRTNWFRIKQALGLAKT